LAHRCGDLNHNGKGLEGSGQAVFKEGQVIEITLGPFKGYQTIFKQFDDEQRAIILLNLLSQQQELLVELKQPHTL
jgi:transcription antitermination factor NusG